MVMFSCHWLQRISEEVSLLAVQCALSRKLLHEVKAIFCFERKKSGDYTWHTLTYIGKNASAYSFISAISAAISLFLCLYVTYHNYTD